MMRATELRIGNKVLHSGEEWFVTPDILMAISDGLLLVDPIPITSERLEQFGFAKVKVFGETRWQREYNGVIYHFQLREQLGADKGMCGAMGVYFPKETIPCPSNKDLEATITTDEEMVNFAFHIKYVHHLQNLFHSLTGQELAN